MPDMQTSQRCKNVKRKGPGPAAVCNLQQREEKKRNVKQTLAKKQTKIRKKGISKEKRYWRRESGNPIANNRGNAVRC
jgi:hypothetical protein